MKILYIHNEYARPSGEEQASQDIVQLLREHGHEVRWYKRSSAEIAGSKFGIIKSFFTGIHNPDSAKGLEKLLDEWRPDVIQVQNLYPLISPSIFAPIKKLDIPVVMRCPNYRLFCPSGLCLDPAGKVCEDCFRGNHEWNCVRKNCLGSRFKSLGYAVRNASARKKRAMLDNVDVFIVQSEFQKKKFMDMGIEEHRIGIVPGLSPTIPEPKDVSVGEGVTFVGRVSAEKGIYEFIEAARMLPSVPFRVAGNLDAAFNKPDDIPANVEFVGFLKGDELNNLYFESRIIVIPSKWYEGFPNVITRGMLLKKPIITTNIGAMQSIIDHNENGLLVHPGDSTDLANAISLLYSDTEKCIDFGLKGRAKAESQYSRDSIYEALEEIYNRAINF